MARVLFLLLLMEVQRPSLASSNKYCTNTFTVEKEHVIKYSTTIKDNYVELSQFVQPKSDFEGVGLNASVGGYFYYAFFGQDSCFPQGEMSLLSAWADVNSTHLRLGFLISSCERECTREIEVAGDNRLKSLSVVAHGPSKWSKGKPCQEDDLNFPAKSTNIKSSLCIPRERDPRQSKAIVFPTTATTTTITTTTTNTTTASKNSDQPTRPFVLYEIFIIVTTTGMAMVVVVVVAVVLWKRKQKQCTSGPTNPCVIENDLYESYDNRLASSPPVNEGTLNSEENVYYDQVQYTGENEETDIYDEVPYSVQNDLYESFSAV